MESSPIHKAEFHGFCTGALLAGVCLWWSSSTLRGRRRRRTRRNKEGGRKGEREREKRTRLRRRERNRVVCHWTPHVEFAFDVWNLSVLLFCCCRCCCSLFLFFVLLLSFLDCSCQRDLWRKNDDDEAVEKNACRRRR